MSVTRHPTLPAHAPRLLRLPDVVARVGLRRSRIYDLIAEGDFPQPVSLSERAVGWYEHEITQWCASRPRAKIGQRARDAGGAR